METSCVILPYIILGICEVCGSRAELGPKTKCFPGVAFKYRKSIGQYV